VALRSDFDAAAARVVKLREFQRAKVVRVHLNKNAYQIRLAALKAGKTLLAVQSELYDLLLLDSAKIPASKYEEAASASGITTLGEKIGVARRSRSTSS